MPPDLYVDRILDDEGLICELDEAEASVLVAALVERVHKLCVKSNDAKFVSGEVQKLSQRGRRVAAVVAAFRDKGEAEAKRMAVAEGWSWPVGIAAQKDLLVGMLNQLH